MTTGLTITIGLFLGNPIMTSNQWGLTWSDYTMSAKVGTCVSITLHFHKHCSTLSKSFKTPGTNPAGAHQSLDFFFGTLTGKHIHVSSIRWLRNSIRSSNWLYTGPKGLPSLHCFLCHQIVVACKSVLSLVEVIHMMRQRKPRTWSNRPWSDQQRGHTSRNSSLMRLFLYEMWTLRIILF